MKRCFALLLLCFTQAAWACEPEGLVVRYLHAIESMDWALMQRSLSPGATYTDPTMTYYDRPAINLTGPDDIVTFWRSASSDSGTSEIVYTITSCFETAGYHVVNLDIRIRVSGAFWNVNRDEIVIPGKLTSVIRVDGGLVTEHHDYVDYAGAERHVGMLREKFGPSASNS